MKARVNKSLLLPELILLNGEEIDRYIENKTTGGVSNSKLRELKRIRQRIKNREYAKRSRERVKTLLQLLRDTCDSLEEENTLLKQKIQDLETQKTEELDKDRMKRYSGYNFSLDWLL